MNKFILTELILLACIVMSSVFGFISWHRAGQIFLGIGVIALIMSIAAWRGWPMLRGDISHFAPLSKRDSSEIIGNGYPMEQGGPSIGFVLRVTVSGFIAIALGLYLILSFS